MPVPRAVAGECARRRSNFLLLRQKKVTKEKATPSLRPLRGAKGQTCGGAVAGCAVELAVLLCSAARTTTASQFTKHARCDARATPQPPRRRRSHRGWIAKQPNIQTATRVVATLDPVSAVPSARRLRPRSGAEQSDGPCGYWFPIPSVCAEERSGQRIRDRDCLSAASLSETPLDASTAGCPSAQRWGRRQWGRLLLPSFLGDARKEGAPPGAYPGTRPQTRHASKPAHKPRIRQAQPERTAARQDAISSVAASAYPISARTQKHPRIQVRSARVSSLSGVISSP